MHCEVNAIFGMHSPHTEVPLFALTDSHIALIGCMTMLLLVERRGGNWKRGKGNEIG